VLICPGLWVFASFAFCLPFFPPFITITKVTCSFPSSSLVLLTCLLLFPQPGPLPPIPFSQPLSFPPFFVKTYNTECAGPPLFNQYPSVAGRPSPLLQCPGTPKESCRGGSRCFSSSSSFLFPAGPPLFSPSPCLKCTQSTPCPSHKNATRLWGTASPLLCRHLVCLKDATPDYCAFAYT
jgi:hypothetical protein